MGLSESQQAVIRWFLMITAILLIVVGVALLGVGASGTSINFYGLTVGGIVLMCFGIVLGGILIIAGCCCDSSRWLCGFSACNK